MTFDSHSYFYNMIKYEKIIITEYVGEIVRIFFNLTKGFEFEPCECNYVL